MSRAVKVVPDRLVIWRGHHPILSHFSHLDLDRLVHSILPASGGNSPDAPRSAGQVGDQTPSSATGQRRGSLLEISQVRNLPYSKSDKATVCGVIM